MPDPEAMARLGGRLCDAARKTRAQWPRDRALVVYLAGELGAGKTTLARAWLRTLGVTGPVRSPTYTLVEPYRADGQTVFHLDLYRVADPDELEYLGLRDMMAPGNLLLVEWPERGEGLRPAASVVVSIEHDGDGRRVELAAGDAAGAAILTALAGGGCV